MNEYTKKMKHSDIFPAKMLSAWYTVIQRYNSQSAQEFSICTDVFFLAKTNAQAL